MNDKAFATAAVDSTKLDDAPTWVSPTRMRTHREPIATLYVPTERPQRLPTVTEIDIDQLWANVWAD